MLLIISRGLNGILLRTVYLANAVYHSKCTEQSCNNSHCQPLWTVYQHFGCQWSKALWDMLSPGVRVIGEPIAIGWPVYRVVGKRLALVSKSAGQRTKRIFEALLKLTNKMAGSMG